MKANFEEQIENFHCSDGVDFFLNSRPFPLTSPEFPTSSPSLLHCSHVGDRDRGMAALPSAATAPSPQNKGPIAVSEYVRLMDFNLLLTVFVYGRPSLQGFWPGAAIRSRRRYPGSRSSS